MEDRVYCVSEAGSAPDEPTGKRCEADFSGIAAFGSVAALAAAVIGFGVLARPPSAEAVPSFARQTGQPCSTCHTAFPELTPFGRRFKLGGYTMGGGLSFTEAPPVSAMVIPTFTHTQTNQDAPPSPGTHTNNNTVLQQASLFYGGKIYENVGAFIQGTYDRASQHVFLDNTDIRYADTTKFLGMDLLYGVTVNNSPTVQDVWNTTPAWGFPYIASTLAPQFRPPGTMVEGTFAGKVAGTGVYTFWNDMLYLEVTAYRNLSTKTLNALGEPGIDGSTALSGAAPYWRAAFEYNKGDHSLEIGTFGMYANTLPARVGGFGFDNILDVGFDTQYQFLGDPHSFTAKLTYITEHQQLNSTFLQGNSSNNSNSLESFKASLGYVYNHTYSLTAAYFAVSGTSDAGLYGGNSLTNSPNGNGLIFDAAYLPFSNGGPSIYPWINARVGISYTRYLKLYGGSTNFDGSLHNSSDNNTVFLVITHPPCQEFRSLNPFAGWIGVICSSSAKSN